MMKNLCLMYVLYRLGCQAAREAVLERTLKCRNLGKGSQANHISNSRQVLWEGARRNKVLRLLPNCLQEAVSTTMTCITSPASNE
jgi:hypothetical protein